jgi:hypothetical protein
MISCLFTYFICGLSFQTVLRLHNFGINWGLAHGRTFLFRGMPMTWMVPVTLGRCSLADPAGEALADDRFVPNNDPDHVIAREVAREECAMRECSLADYGQSGVREAIREGLLQVGLKRPASSRSAAAASVESDEF